MATDAVTRVQHEALEFGLSPMPPRALEALARWDAPPRLIAHLFLVHDVGLRLARALQPLPASAAFDLDAIRYGAATHDIGKALYPEELSEPGKRHEVAGEARLVEEGVLPERARFCRTHGVSVQSEALELEDLIVITADKVWKGKRVSVLEERLTQELSLLGGTEYWQTWSLVCEALDDLAAGADARLAWQARFSAA